MAVAAVLVSPHFLFRVETDPAGIPAEHPVSGQRPGAGVAALLLPLEQHSGRRAPRRRGEGPAARAGGARTPGPPDARRPTLAVAREQLRGAVAAPPQPGLDHAGHAAVSGLRRQPAPGVSPGDGALFRERAARGPERARSASRQLHVRERTTGEALRHPARLRQPVPARHARRGQRARRPAASGQHPHRDLVCDENVAGRPRQVGARQPDRSAPSSAAAGRPRAQGQHRGRQPDGAQASGRTQEQRRVRGRATT